MCCQYDSNATKTQYSNFNEIVKADGEMYTKWECRKSSKIVESSHMSQKTPKRRSPDPYKYKLKSIGAVDMPQMLPKRNAFKKQCLMAS